MVCFCYKRYSIGKKAYICLDVAQTNYYGVHQFSIVARGTTYLDDMATIHYPLDRMVQSEIHSFIECDKPQIKPKG